jgi:hypothetical protein
VAAAEKLRAPILEKAQKTLEFTFKVPTAKKWGRGRLRLLSQGAKS